MAGLRTAQHVRETLSRKLSHGFAENVVGSRDDWPCTIPLGRPSKEEILGGFHAIDELMSTLRTWEAEGNATITYAMREAGGPKRLPTHVTIPSLDAAATLASPRAQESWVRVIARARRRLDQLVSRFPQLGPDKLAYLLRRTDAFDDLQFELLLSAGSWFRDNDAHGLTPREVPLPGIDGKWLDRAQHRSMVCLLADKDDLGLRSQPCLVEFAYLDPQHLANGGRHYDSHREGDATSLAYPPRIVIIVENKDTYLDFPRIAKGICIFGSGKAGMAIISQLDWILGADEVVYWGDLDADGFEILNAYRLRGVRCTSMLMDAETLRRFERYGTMLEKDHKTSIVRTRKELVTLTDGERAAYELLTSASYRGNVRVEQEKIPLTEVTQALANVERTSRNCRTPFSK